MNHMHNNSPKKEKIRQDIEKATKLIFETFELNGVSIPVGFEACLSYIMTIAFNSNMSEEGLDHIFSLTVDCLKKERSK